MLSEISRQVIEENAAAWTGAFSAAGVDLSAKELEIFQEGMVDYAQISVRMFAWFVGVPIAPLKGGTDLAILPIHAFQFLWNEFTNKHPYFMPLMNKIKAAIAEANKVESGGTGVPAGQEEVA